MYLPSLRMSKTERTQYWSLWDGSYDFLVRWIRPFGAPVTNPKHFREGSHPPLAKGSVQYQCAAVNTVPQTTLGLPKSRVLFSLFFLKDAQFISAYNFIMELRKDKKGNCHSSGKGEKPLCLLCLITKCIYAGGIKRQNQKAHGCPILLLVQTSLIMNWAVADKAHQRTRASSGRC